MGKDRICDAGGEGMFLSPMGDGTKPNISVALPIGILLMYCFLGVAIISDIFMSSIETVTSWKGQVKDKESGKSKTVMIWHETVATLTLMALGSSAPEIFLAVIENFKRGFHSGDLGPSTIVGSAAFNLFVIIAVCIAVIPGQEIRKIANVHAFLVTAVFSIGAYMWMVFALVIHGQDVIDPIEAVLTLLFLPLLVWISYSIDVGILSRWVKGAQEEDVSCLPKERCHCVGFAISELIIAGASEAQEVEITVVRHGEMRTETQCTYRMEGLNAIPNYDFEDVAGTIEFASGETQVVLKLTIPSKSSSAVARKFLLILENSDGTCDFDPDGDGEAESAILTLKVENLITQRSVSRGLDSLVNNNSIRYAFGEWLEQITSVIYCNGSWEEQQEAGWQDLLYHIFAFPWKLVFSVIPPTSFFGGWLSFVVSIAGIGMCTAFISDVAEMFGCLLDCPDVVTATTFVALGTSMPDLFASVTAAVGDPTADASIVNVTGSNSVNVFLGLGIPWTCASVYWNFLAERDADWEERYPEVAANAKYAGSTVFVVESRNLGFCVFIFSGLCVIAIVLLILRRRFLGAELGGPVVPKYASCFLLIWLWLAFVSLTSWRVLRCEGAKAGDWCKASVMEQSIVCGGVMFVTFLVSIPTLISTAWYSKNARAEARSQLQGRRWSQVVDIFAMKDDDDVKGGGNGKAPTDAIEPATENERSNSKDSGDKLRTVADSTADAPDFDELFTRTEAKEKRLHTDIRFMRVAPGTAHRPSCGSHRVSMLPSVHAKNNAIVSVIVVAYHSRGRNETVFQTTVSKPLRQVMRAWCKQHQLDEAKAAFTYHSKRLEPSATVASLGHDPAKGPMVLHARPKSSEKKEPGAEDFHVNVEGEENMGEV